MTCRHRSRSEATACHLFRARKSERIAPLHGPNDFRWQLSVSQDAILGSIAHADPRPTDIQQVFGPIRFIFEDDASRFASELLELRAIGLVWVDCDTGLTGYTAEGRAHIEAELADKGTSLAQLRLGAQAQAPSTYRYQASFFDRVMSRLAAHDERRIIDAPLATEVLQ